MVELQLLAGLPYYYDLSGKLTGWKTMEDVHPREPLVTLSEAAQIEDNGEEENTRLVHKFRFTFFFKWNFLIILELPPPTLPTPCQRSNSDLMHAGHLSFTI